MGRVRSCKPMHPARDHGQPRGQPAPAEPGTVIAFIVPQLGDQNGVSSPNEPGVDQASAEDDPGVDQGSSEGAHASFWEDCGR